MSKQAHQVEIATPARIMPGHTLDRETSTAAGAPKAWRALSPVQACFERGQLEGGTQKYTALDRFDAAQSYAQHYLAIHSMGRNILDMDRVSSSGNSAGLTEAQADASRWLICVDSNMGPNDRAIIRYLTGDEYSPAEAIARALGADYCKATMPRLREALDALCASIETARKNKFWKVNFGSRHV